MKDRDARWDLQQAEYLLEYDRRKIQDCVDIFRNLATVYCRMGEKEVFPAAERRGADVTGGHGVRGAEDGWDGQETCCGEIALCDRERLLQEEAARENRLSLAEQMRQLASLMQDVAGASVQMIRLGARQERQIVRAMAGEGLTVSDVYLLRGKEGKLELSALVSSKKERTVTVQDIAGYFSILLDLRLTAQKRNPYFIGKEPVTLYFEEESAFMYLTGAATAVKEGEMISGDSFSFWEQDGKMAVMLSDGVGSGEGASEDSGQVVDLAEQILDAGLSPGMAVQMLNSMMRAQSQELHRATLDLCCLDLQDGTARFVKAGGVCSFIRRGDDVERVGESTLPLGFEKEEQILECCRRLESGDMVIMLSDGIVQEWPGEDCFSDIQEQIGLMESKSPQDMANRILRYAIGRCRGKIRDDMTVLTVGIWENGDGADGGLEDM